MTELQTRTKYTYDGDGRRAAKVGSKLYWYGSGGEILAETNASGSTLNEYIFFGGKRVAMLPSGSAAQFYAEDALGSSRTVTTNTGVVCYDADFAPYGAENAITNSCTQNVYKFEGKERDAETSTLPGDANGNDYFGARYYSNRYGRWLSADWSNVPAPVPYANLTNPQTLDLYSMVSDDPESFADLDGHEREHGLPEEAAEACARGVVAACDTDAEKQQAIALSKSQAQNQPNNRTGYDTQDQAAGGALRNSNGASIQRNKEEAGLIYKKDGKYHFTGPVEGTDQGANPHDAKAPRGSRVVGDYHTHGDYSIMGPNGEAIRTHDPHRDDFNSAHFSGPDKTGIAHDAIGKPEYRGYLGTPSGKFLTYNPATGQEGELQ